MKKPNRWKMEETSGPDSLFSLGISRFDFHRNHQRWIRGQSQSIQVFPIQVERYGFLEIASDLIQRLTLRDNRDFHAFGHVARFFAAPDDGLDGFSLSQPGQSPLHRAPATDQSTVPGAIWPRSSSLTRYGVPS